MDDRGFEHTVQSLRRIVVTGGAAAAVLLVGAVVLLALSLLFQVAQISPFGLWGVIAVVAVASLVAILVGWQTTGGFRARRRVQAMLPADVLLPVPPPPPPRVERGHAAPAVGGRFGVEATVNRLIAEQRYDDALDRLAELEQTDPTMAGFCAVKRRALARRQGRRSVFTHSARSQ